jgi:hypothetical protein
MTSVIKNEGLDVLEFKSLCSIESPGFALSGDLGFKNNFDAEELTKGPIPFTFNRRNGELDIDASIAGFQETMIDISEQLVTRDLDVLVRYIGTTGHIVNSLGNKFKEFIRSWRQDTIDEDSPINIYTKPSVMRVMVYAPRLGVTHGRDIYPATIRGGIEDTSPDSNKYYNNQCIYTTYVFKTPLVFTIVESGVTRYVIFQSDNGED